MKKRVREPQAAIANNDSKLAEQPLVTEKITAGIEKVYDWHSDTVIMDVWDGGNIDGDKITLSYNGKPYLTDYYLVKEKKRLRIPVSDHGIDVINILAVNEGSDPPNTANLLLTAGTAQYSILAYNPKGQMSIIKIRKAR